MRQFFLGYTICNDIQNTDGGDCMNAQGILAKASELQPQLQSIRRDLHQHPELGFDLTYTKEFVKNELLKMGYKPILCGKAGLVVLVGGKKPGKTILLRADMDALALKEEADIDFKSQYEGKMHGCGHDMHTAMLLGAAKILKEHENEIRGTGKLVFQPAEEIFQGANDMIQAGVLENPDVDAALMIHVMAGLPMSSGSVLVPGGGISMASCEQYHIHVRGKGGHGSAPHIAIDPITAAAHIHIALQEINSRELAGGEFGVFTTCHFDAGKTSNVIPDDADMWGTIRTIDPDGNIGGQIKERMTEITESVAKAYRCEALVEFYDYCPCMVIDESLADAALKYMNELLGQGAVSMKAIGMDKPAGGSEDFAFVSHKVPTVSMFLAAGNEQEGYIYSQHNPKVRFDDSVLFKGSAAYAYAALRWLGEN